LHVLTTPRRRSFVLRATGLTKLYGTTVALVGVELTARSGELTLVRGANASGKSTLLRLLAGLAVPTAGQVSVAGEAGAPARVSYAGHAGHLYPDLTAVENVDLASGLAGGDRRGGVALLDRLGVAASARQRCRGLSSGTLRRVALARALATDPDVLIADEPFAGVDGASADRVATVLAELRAEGRLVVIASHERSRSDTLADQTVELNGGRLAQPPAGLTGRPIEGGIAR
jgi:ABC-type multidrug transport system ATPase subunit